VNIASRMESHGEPGRIQVTESAYQALKGDFYFEERGVIDIKGRGKMATYWLLGDRTSETASGHPTVGRTPIILPETNRDNGRISENQLLASSGANGSGLGDLGSNGTSPPVGKTHTNGGNPAAATNGTNGNGDSGSLGGEEEGEEMSLAASLEALMWEEALTEDVVFDDHTLFFDSIESTGPRETGPPAEGEQQG
ncbi:MAG: adenylate/guanylate cyclase domain-containing protein, partial [Cyanobacteria bacterium P01_H01_bin.130]